MAKAITKYVRISPRKARLAAGLIRKRKVEDALIDLEYSKLRGGELLTKTLKSAVANAENNEGKDRKNLFVAEVRVDEGPTIKRGKSRSRGSSVPVLKRTSHFTVVVEESKQQAKE